MCAYFPFSFWVGPTVTQVCCFPDVALLSFLLLFSSPVVSRARTLGGTPRPANRHPVACFVRLAMHERCAHISAEGTRIIFVM